MKKFQIYIRLNPQATSESLFLAPVKEVSETLIYSENPIKKKNIESFFNESSNIDSFQKNFLREFTVFNFDAIFSHTCSQSKFFENLSPLLIPFPQPHCFIFSGLEDSGKTFSLLGDEHSLTGLLPSFIENIFNETKLCYISAYRLYKNKLRDLGEENETFFRRELRKEENWKESLVSLRKRAKFFGGYNCFIVLESFVKGRTTKTLFVRLADFTSQFQEEIRNLKMFIEEGQSTDSSLISSIIELMEDKVDKFIWTINLECNPIDLKSTQQLLQIIATQKNGSERKAKPPLSPKFEMLSKRKYDDGLPKNVFSTYRSNFREKQEVLSREVSAIKERFSQKKAYLESIVPKTIRNTPKIENNLKATERNSSLENDIQRLKQEIISKIEIQKANDLSPNRSSEELPQKYDNSLDILKSALTEKELLDKQKIHHLKKLNEELKESLKNYIINNDNLNNEMQKADDHIINLEEKIASGEELIQQHQNAERRLKENEGHLLRTIDDYKKKITEIENKLGSKREKLRKVRMDFEESKRENGGEIEIVKKMLVNEKEKNSELANLLKNLEAKNIDLSTRFDSLSSDCLQISRENEELKIQLDGLKEENLKSKTDLSRLGDIHQEITQNFALLQIKYEDLKESAKGLEAKILKNKNKFDQEKQALSSDLSQKILKKKTKLKSFKEQILEIDNLNKNLNFENNELKRKIEDEIGRVKNLKGEIEVKKGELNDAKARIEETERGKQCLHTEKEEIEIALMNERNEKSNLFSENEKLKKIVKSSERKLTDLESILEKQANSLASLKDELNNTSAEKNEYKNKFEKISFEYENLIQQHNTDSDLVESKLSQLIRELKQQSDEKKDLAKKENELKKEIIFSQENTQKYKEKYIKVKLANKALKAHLLEVEAKTKEFILEKQMEMREAEEMRDNREKNVNSKMKILDDIHNLVRTYRTRKV